MKKQTSLVIFYLATSGSVSNTALAADETDPGPIVPDELISAPIINEIEVGIGYVSDDAYKFGRYTGLQGDGTFLLGEITLRELSEEGSFLSLRGRDLGTDDRYLRMDTGIAGIFASFL